jgi:hypothetical protein
MHFNASSPLKHADIQTDLHTWAIKLNAHVQAEGKSDDRK